VRRFYQSIPCSYLQNEGERRRIKRKKREGGKYESEREIGGDWG